MGDGIIYMTRMLNRLALFCGIDRAGLLGNVLHLTIVAAFAACMYYLLFGSTQQSYRYISELVSPLTHPDADLSSLQPINTGHPRIAAYRVSADTALYIELDTPYTQSRLLPIIGRSTLGSTRYGSLRGKSDKDMKFDTRMLASGKGTPEQCSQYLAHFMPQLHAALNSKPWPLEFELRTSSHQRPIASIESRTFAGYRPPRIFGLCLDSTFVFVTTLDH